MKIKWLPGINACRLHVSSERLFINGKMPKQVSLHFGNFQKIMTVKLNRRLPPNTIGIPVNAILPFTVPKHLPYQIQIRESGIFIGPVIGMLIPSERPLDRYACFFREYKRIGGIVFLFKAEHINPDNQTIQGYYFDPRACSPSLRWKKVLVPYPDAVYKRASDSKLPIEFMNQMDEKIFNAPMALDKWQLWRILSENPEVREHLPRTELLHGIAELEDMLRIYNVVYLKRLLSLQSLGLFMVRKTETGYLFIDRDRNETPVQSEAVPGFIESLIENSPYIVQQAVPLKYNGRHVDFRVIMQKDRTKYWQCTGVLARFGASGSVSTNFMEAGYLRLGEPALQLLFGLNRKQATKKIEEMISVCKTACEWLDRFGNFADVGLDVVVDPDQNVWILEINKYQHMELPLYIKGNYKMYRRVKANPFEYAKSFAGF